MNSGQRLLLFGVLMAQILLVACDKTDVNSQEIGANDSDCADGSCVQVMGANDSDCADGSCDSKTFQDALDAASPGDMLMLEGTFDFGDDQFVSLKKDVTIQGKRGRENEYLAIIKGGMNTLALGWDPALGIPEFDESCMWISTANNQRWPAEFTISDLQFEEPIWSAIMGAATTGATIRSNRFIGGLQIDAGCNAYDSDGPPDGSMSAVFFTTELDARNPVFGKPSDITGHVRIEDNYFDGQARMDPDGFDPVHGLSSLVHDEAVRMNGVLIPIEVTGTEAQITIQENEFERIMWGLFVSDNSGEQIIRDNTIRLNPEDEEGNPIGFSWAGISVQNSGGELSAAPVLIAGNYIFTRVSDFFFGILVSSKAAIIQNNTLELYQVQESLWNPLGDSAGIKIWDGSEGVLVSGNMVKGSGQTAIVVEGIEGAFMSINNVIEDNNLLDFTPLEATDTLCRVEGGSNCPAAAGAHYHLNAFTASNSVTDESWAEGMVLIDDTSDFNPYSPATYNGDNLIELRHGP